MSNFDMSNANGKADDTIFDGYFFAPVGEQVELTESMIASMRRTNESVSLLLQQLEKSDLAPDYIIKAYHLIKDNYTVRRGKRLVPTEKGRQLIVKIHDKFSHYRFLVLETNDYGPYPSREIYELRCAMYDLIQMYDEYCAGICDLILSATSQHITKANASENNITSTERNKGGALANAANGSGGGTNTPKMEDNIESTPDSPHLTSFEPHVKFDMSELYLFLIEESVVINIDEKQFTECIENANIKPLWETTNSKNKLKLALLILKDYYKDQYQQKNKTQPTWFLKCCESIGKSTSEMSKMKFKPDTRVKFRKEMANRIKVQVTTIP